MNKNITSSTIEQFSFQLGMINCFVEMVACGVKKLALSPPLLPDDYEKITPYSEKTVRGFGIKSFLEKSLLLTKLQTPEFTKGKWSILYYKTDEVLHNYLKLKAKKTQLEKEGRFDSRSETEISVEFMKLLSYPEEVIKEKLSGDRKDPYMLKED